MPVKLTASVIELKGSDILNFLTNALTYYPEADGRFAQMSGLKVTFDPSKKPSQRITSVLVNGEILDESKVYQMAVTNHLIANKLNGTFSNDMVTKEEYYQTIQQMFVEYLNKYNYNQLDIIENRIILEES